MNNGSRSWGDTFNFFTTACLVVGPNARRETNFVIMSPFESLISTAYGFMFNGDDGADVLSWGTSDESFFAVVLGTSFLAVLWLTVFK